MILNEVENCEGKGAGAAIVSGGSLRLKSASGLVSAMRAGLKRKRG